MEAKVHIPTFDRMMNPLLQALRELGGSGTVNEIATKVARIMNLSVVQLEVLHSPGKSSQTEFEYRLAWTRTFLKRYGLLDNPSRGVWALTPRGRKTMRVDEKEVVYFVREQFEAEKKGGSVRELKASNSLSLQETENACQEAENSSEEEGAPEKTESSWGETGNALQETGTSWQEELRRILLQLSPDAFERLIQRLFRECGFVQVMITGHSEDGGIEGWGIMRVGGLLSFHVLFQCKQWQDPVEAAHIRDFRGSLIGRAEKGLFLTTGSFTKEAIQEATRNGASPIDLIGGKQLAEKLKELSLGVQTEVVEKVKIDRDWFSTL